MTYIYNIKYLFERKHYNPPFNQDYHSHEFVVNFELRGDVVSDYNTSEYGIDTVEFQKYLGRFCETLPSKLNEDNRLKNTSCSTEALCQFFWRYFPIFLQDSGYKKARNIFCLSISVFEGPYRETKLPVNQELFKTNH